jgi:hypothetical protein
LVATDDVNKGKLAAKGVTNGAAIAACCAFDSLSTSSDVDVVAKGGNVRPLRLRNRSSVECVVVAAVVDVTAEAESPPTGKRNAFIPTEIQERLVHGMSNQRLREIHPTIKGGRMCCCPHSNSDPDAVIQKSFVPGNHQVHDKGRSLAIERGREC